MTRPTIAGKRAERMAANVVTHPIRPEKENIVHGF
jgi:hypothetical protein